MSQHREALSFGNVQHPACMHVSVTLSLLIFYIPCSLHWGLLFIGVYMFSEGEKGGEAKDGGGSRHT
ncbi:hypothetical protein M747DRAFT_142561 [Aspergillus niger ATCC 13496]|uniref:Uncharacterized protein n=1 Tax=Aspergillus niger ATCC 13496 TaxID=1353008 RepID=A0A370BM86_ASPNG|nr:hypothetical protein M747DRAFT_142561 [Aspergillus niger ATCC 13496]